MPQLDRIIIFSQIFWLFLIFTTLYIILTHHFLPKFLKILKARKQIIEANSQEIAIRNAKLAEQQLILKQVISKNLLTIEKAFKKELEISNPKNLQINLQLIDEKVVYTSLNSLMYCNSTLLSTIVLYPRSLNLK